MGREEKRGMGGAAIEATWQVTTFIKSSHKGAMVGGTTSLTAQGRRQCPPFTSLQSHRRHTCKIVFKNYENKRNCDLKERSECTWGNTGRKLLGGVFVE